MVLCSSITAKSQPHRGKLQATSPLFVVQGWPPAQGVPGEGKCCNCQLAKGEKAHPANSAAADTQRKRCRKGSHREHPRLQREGCSTHTSPPQVCPLRRSEVAQSNSSGLRHTRWQWQVQPQWNQGSLHPYTNMNSKQQVIQLGLQM
jgi:hypothetical protein